VVTLLVESCLAQINMRQGARISIVTDYLARFQDALFPTIESPLQEPLTERKRCFIYRWRLSGSSVSLLALSYSEWGASVDDRSQMSHGKWQSRRACKSSTVKLQKKRS